MLNAKIPFTYIFFVYPSDVVPMKRSTRIVAKSTAIVVLLTQIVVPPLSVIIRTTIPSNRRRRNQKTPGGRMEQGTMCVGRMRGDAPEAFHCN